MDKLVASVLTMLHEWQEQEEHPQPQEQIHRHSFDIKLSKVFTTVVAVSILCFVSLVGNYFLWQSKQQYKDDALKFRIIRVWRGCSPKEILWLSDVFDIHRDATRIKRIKKQTDNYNLELKAKADSLMQNNLQNKKSEYLLFFVYCTRIFTIFTNNHILFMESPTNRIKEVLIEKGIKQTWFAEKLGKSFTIVNSYVCNRRQPSLELLFQIAEILQVNPKDLIVFVDKELSKEQLK